MSKSLIRKIQATSLKEAFIEQFEGLILSGHFKPGEKIPAERSLSELMSVSRPVVHEGLTDLAAKGLVTILPRKGCFVNDYRRDGSLELLGSLVNFKGGHLSEGLFQSLLETRILFENEAARRAAEIQDKESIKLLKDVVQKEFELIEKHAEGKIDPILVASLDYAFHLEVAVASKNEIYPLLLNSFKKIYLTVLSSFYEDLRDLSGIYNLHKKTLSAIENGNTKVAYDSMNAILLFGENEMKRTVAEKQKKGDKKIRIGKDKDAS